MNKDNGVDETKERRVRRAVQRRVGHRERERGVFTSQTE